jgi:tetratricopeptide (TPR) repeat protein
MSTPTKEGQVEPQNEIPDLFSALETYSQVFGPYHPRTLTVVQALALALLEHGDTNGAIDLLGEALQHLTSFFGKDHPARVDVLHSLGQITLSLGRLDDAVSIFREVLECDTRYAGPNHPSSLEAKSDLAAVLFELGQDEEADLLEGEACKDARQHLGLNHSITTLLSWNRALSFERRGDFDSARKLFTDGLAWLLVGDPACLEPGQKIIRDMLVERSKWNAAPVC